MFVWRWRWFEEDNVVAVPGAKEFLEVLAINTC